MNTHRLAPLVAACLLAACPVVSVTAAADSTPTAPAPAPAQWTEIKDYTYDMRAPFLAGLKGLEVRVDE
jgi:hypothetical protein